MEPVAACGHAADIGTCIEEQEDLFYSVLPHGELLLASFSGWFDLAKSPRPIAERELGMGK